MPQPSEPLTLEPTSFRSQDQSSELATSRRKIFNVESNRAMIVSGLVQEGEGWMDDGCKDTWKPDETL